MDLHILKLATVDASLLADLVNWSPMVFVGIAGILILAAALILSLLKGGERGADHLQPWPVYALLGVCGVAMFVAASHELVGPGMPLTWSW